MCLHFKVDRRADEAMTEECQKQSSVSLIYISIDRSSSEQAVVLAPKHKHFPLFTFLHVQSLVYRGQCLEQISTYPGMGKVSSATHRGLVTYPLRHVKNGT